MTGDARTGSPFQQLLDYINSWHANNLASTKLTPKAFQMLLDKAHMPELPFVEPAPAAAGKRGVPDGSGHRCVRCRRKLQWIHWLDGKPYGSVCVTKESNRD